MNKKSANLVCSKVLYIARGGGGGGGGGGGLGMGWTKTGKSRE